MFVGFGPLNKRIAIHISNQVQMTWNFRGSLIWL